MLIRLVAAGGIFDVRIVGFEDLEGVLQQDLLCLLLLELILQGEHGLARLAVCAGRCG